jgi:hypothetical protein
MDVVTAYRRLALRSVDDRQAVLPVSPRSNPHAQRLWPYAATAAVLLSGCLDDALDDAQLDEGIEHFESLRSCGVFSGDDWERGMIEVAEAVAAARQAKNGPPACARNAAE